MIRVCRHLVSPGDRDIQGKEPSERSGMERKRRLIAPHPTSGVTTVYPGTTSHFQLPLGASIILFHYACRRGGGVHDLSRLVRGRWGKRMAFLFFCLCSKKKKKKDNQLFFGHIFRRKVER